MNEFRALSGVKATVKVSYTDSSPFASARGPSTDPSQPERGHVDGEAVPHVRPEQSLVGLVDLLDRDALDIRGDVMCAAEVEHLLGLADAADGRAGEAAAPEEEPEGGDGERLRRRADEGDVAVSAQELDVGADVVIGGDGVEDEGEAAGVPLHLVGVAGDDGLVGAEAKRGLLLAGRPGERADVGSERGSGLHAPVAE